MSAFVAPSLSGVEKDLHKYHFLELYQRYMNKIYTLPSVSLDNVRCNTNLTSQQQYAMDRLFYKNATLELEKLFGDDRLIYLARLREMEISDEDNNFSRQVMDMFLDNRDRDLFRTFLYDQAVGFGSYSVVFVFRGDSKQIIVKMSAPSKSIKDNLEFYFPFALHEFFIGYVAINELVGRIPNFVTTYGITRCTPAFDIRTIKGKRLVDIDNIVRGKDVCLGSEENFYIIQEKAIGTSLASVLRNLTEKEFLSIFLQVFFAMWSANSSEYHFVHFDLSSNNVIVNKNVNPNIYYYSVPVFSTTGDYIDDDDFYIRSNITTTIIDYGMSKIDIDADVFAIYRPEFRRLMICPESDRAILGDIHKFLSHSLVASVGMNISYLVAHLYILLFGDMFALEEKDIHPKIKQSFSDYLDSTLYNYDFDRDSSTMQSLMEKMLMDSEISGMLFDDLLYTNASLDSHDLELEVINPPEEELKHPDSLLVRKALARALSETPDLPLGEDIGTMIDDEKKV